MKVTHMSQLAISVLVFGMLSCVLARAQVSFEDYGQEAELNPTTITDAVTLQFNEVGGNSDGRLWVGRYGRDGDAGGLYGWYNEDYDPFPDVVCPGASNGDNDMIPTTDLDGNFFNGSFLGCAFLTDNRGTTNPGDLDGYALEIIYQSGPVGGANGYLLDVDGGEAWTIIAYADQDMNVELTRKRVCGDGVDFGTCDYRGSEHAVAADEIGSSGVYRDAAIRWSVACPNMRAIRMEFSGNTEATSGMGLGFDYFDADDPIPGDTCDIPPPVQECCCGEDTIWQERGGERQMWTIDQQGNFVRKYWEDDTWKTEIVPAETSGAPLVIRSLHGNVWGWGVVAVDSNGYLSSTKLVDGEWVSGRPDEELIAEFGGFDPCNLLVTEKGIWGLSNAGKLVHFYPGGGEWHSEVIDTKGNEVAPGTLYENFDGYIGGLLSDGQMWGIWNNEGQLEFDWFGDEKTMPPKDCRSVDDGCGPNSTVKSYTASLEPSEAETCIQATNFLNQVNLMEEFRQVYLDCQQPNSPRPQLVKTSSLLNVIDCSTSGEHGVNVNFEYCCSDLSRPIHPIE